MISEKRKEYNRQYRLKNKEKIQAQREANKEKLKEYYRQYWLEKRDKEKQNECTKKWRSTHKEELAIYQKEYNALNSEKRKTWRQTNRFKMAVHKAKGRKKEFLLTEEQFNTLVAKPCYYCDDKAKTKEEFGIGLDRIDNSKGYSEDNVLPCCSFCNAIRNNRLTVEETKVAIQAIILYRSSL